MGSKVPPKIASFKECTGCSGAACQAARRLATGAPGGLPTRRRIPSCPTWKQHLHSVTDLETLVALENLHRIVAAGEIMAGLVLQAFDALAFVEHGKDQVLRYHNHAVVFAENKVARMNLHRLCGLARNAHGHLALQHRITPKCFDRAAVARKNWESHPEQVAGIARAAVDQRARRPTSPSRRRAQFAINGNVERRATVADLNAGMRHAAHHLHALVTALGV